MMSPYPSASETTSSIKSAHSISRLFNSSRGRYRCHPRQPWELVPHMNSRKVLPEAHMSHRTGKLNLAPVNGIQGHIRKMKLMKWFKAISMVAWLRPRSKTRKHSCGLLARIKKENSLLVCIRMLSYLDSLLVSKVSQLNASQVQITTQHLSLLRDNCWLVAALCMAS